MFTRILTLFSVLALTAPVAANAAAQQDASFTRDGDTYEVATTPTADGETLIGRNVTTGDRFHLVVVHGYVRGVYAGQPVTFRAPAAMLEQSASR